MDTKERLHPRNLHRGRYDFSQLCLSSPELLSYLIKNDFGEISLDYHNPLAVKSLNRALLKYFYKVELWDIPEGFLCPPIPGRADYIHYAADLLSEGRETPLRGKQVRVLDIGTGANCIYPLLGHALYGWKFTGSDIDPLAVKSAQNIVNANNLSGFIEIRRQKSPGLIFKDLIRKGEMYELSISNPPFHSSYETAMESNERKRKNLGMTGGFSLNFGGTSSELYCEGGELGFLSRMITESLDFKDQVRWFSSLISNKDHLKACYDLLQIAGASKIKTMEMQQGQKKSRILAWSFLPG